MAVVKLSEDIDMVAHTCYFTIERVQADMHAYALMCDRLNESPRPLLSPPVYGGAPELVVEEQEWREWSQQRVLASHAARTSSRYATHTVLLEGTILDLNVHY